MAKSEGRVAEKVKVAASREAPVLPVVDVKRDLTRTTLALLFLGVLIIASLWVVKPFLPAIIWAIMIVIASWPIMLWLQRHLWNNRWLAASVMVLILLLVLVLPLSFATVSIVGNADQLAIWTKWMLTFELPPAPAWLTQLPVIGDSLRTGWEKLAALHIRDLLNQAAPYAFDATKWFISQAGGIGAMLLHFFLTVAVAAILYVDGERAAATVRRFGHRLAGDRGENAVQLAGQAIRGVALGVIVTAVFQAGLGGIGLAIADVPFATLLTALMFMLCIAQLGPSLVLFPAVVWMYWMGDTGWATFLLIWSLPVVILDNFIRPILIKRGADLPILLIFVGVIGGLIGFGLVGIFVGPVVLSVAYTLLIAWMEEDQGGRA
jgi:predicted PurR-regulated permease PerM